MSLETGIIALAEAVGTDVKALNVKIGDLSQLTTTAKNNLVTAINELSASALTIDDDAGLGDATVVWSANKTVTAIQAAVDAPDNPPISWHDQSIENSVTIPPNKNAWSFGPTMTIAEGKAVTVSEGSFWTIANGEAQQ